MLNRLLSPFAALLALALLLASCTGEMVAPPPPPDPVADFEWSGVTVMPAQITFQNLSTNADQYIWNFGDNTTSTDSVPTHIFAQMGLYDVTLTARSSETGVSNSKTIQLPIDAGHVFADFTMPATSVTNAAITLENHSQNAGRSHWILGDGRVSDLTSPVVNYFEYRIFSVTLIAYSRDERRSDTLSKTILINPSKVYLDSISVFQYPPLDPSNRAWDPDDGPDLMWTMDTPSGATISSPVIENALLPADWRIPNAALLLENWDFPYLLRFYDFDAPAMVLMGTVGFTTNQLPVGGTYPREKIFQNDQMRVRIVVHWM